jgi:hypothetical protein
LTHTFRLNKNVDERKTEESPLVGLQILTYDVVNATKFRYRCGDLEKKTVLSNSAISCGVSYTPSSLNNESTIVKVGHNTRFEPVTGICENVESIKFGTPIYGPVSMWKTVIECSLMIIVDRYDMGHCKL